MNKKEKNKKKRNTFLQREQFRINNVPKKDESLSNKNVF